MENLIIWNQSDIEIVIAFQSIFLDMVLE